MADNILNKYSNFREAIRNYEFGLEGPRPIEDGSPIQIKFAPVGAQDHNGNRQFYAETYVSSPDNNNLHFLARKEINSNSRGLPPNKMEELAGSVLQASIEPMNKLANNYKDIASNLESESIKNEKHDISKENEEAYKIKKILEDNYPDESFRLTLDKNNKVPLKLTYVDGPPVSQIQNLLEQEGIDEIETKRMISPENVGSVIDSVSSDLDLPDDMFYLSNTPVGNNIGREVLKDASDIYIDVDRLLDDCDGDVSEALDAIDNATSETAFNDQYKNTEEYEGITLTAEELGLEKNDSANQNPFTPTPNQGFSI